MNIANLLYYSKVAIFIYILSLKMGKHTLNSSSQKQLKKPQINTYTPLDYNTKYRYDRF